jgi:hypothetical protein
MAGYWTSLVTDRGYNKFADYLDRLLKARNTLLTLLLLDRPGTEDVLRYDGITDVLNGP